MKVSRMLLIVICFLFIFTVISGCASSTEPISIDEEVPIWQLSDTEYGKLDKQTKLSVYSMEYLQKPAFYDGSVPFKFESYKRPLGMGETQDIADKFEGFTNLFIYQNPFTLIGAQTCDSEGNLLAEIRIHYFTDEVNKNPEAEEFHYKNGKLIFTCKSTFRFATGEKISEEDAVGKKITDYYFIIPL